jgi:hypothetical protein
LSESPCPTSRKATGQIEAYDLQKELEQIAKVLQEVDCAAGLISQKVNDSFSLNSHRDNKHMNSYRLPNEESMV